MLTDKKITKIPAGMKFPTYTRVAIYCRVSTHKPEQGDSLEAQIARFEAMVKTRVDWKLVGTYNDFASGKNTSGRAGFRRMMDDCRGGSVDLILTKSVSRLGRNTVDILENIRELRRHDVDVFCEVENMHVAETSAEFILSVISAVAQEDSVSRSKNIKMGIAYQMQNGTSWLYTCPCYGYRRSQSGELVIDKRQARNVQLIFDLYSDGHSVVSIVRQLKKRRIKSPSSGDTWSKRTIETMLCSEKYIGDVVTGKTYTGEFPNNKRRINRGEQAMYEMRDAHPGIISRELFDRVQQERKARSNLRTVEGKVVRAPSRYSMKRTLGDTKRSPEGDD